MQAVTTAAEINTNSTYIIVAEGASKALGTFSSGKSIPSVDVIISSSIRVLCNISLSLKMLNDKGVIQQPIQKQQSSGITGNTHNNSPVTCPECGHSCEKGLSACPNCGYPFD